ncbi:unnamed protein product [Caenorhabditis auriculariae]|uniref:G-protein coupled receptors family 1 profile domain-containing protein n=1 Tax=Caenorhabditis auriculariae TaxID=2777116 RepID=A0A8S1HET6_9PELO|nr:unnamed protein product [Caenorhabditis auriculariae]
MTGFCSMLRGAYTVATLMEGSSFIAIMVERTIASVYFRTYETRTMFHLGVVLAATQWTLATFTMIGSRMSPANKNNYSRLPCQKDLTSGKIAGFIVAFVLLGDILSFFGFLRIFFYNLRLHKHRNTRRTSLKEIYQITENVRTTRTLSPVLAAMLTGSLAECFLVVYRLYVDRILEKLPENEKEPFFVEKLGRGAEVSQLFDILSDATKISFCYLMLAHPSLYRRFRRMYWRSSKVEQSKSAPVALDGTDLQFNTSEETEHHFGSLRQLWK